jgi:hypothetical protein
VHTIPLNQTEPPISPPNLGGFPEFHVIHEATEHSHGAKVDVVVILVTGRKY